LISTIIWPAFIFEHRKEGDHIALGNLIKI